MKEIIIENTGAKYSEMLVQLVEYFDAQLPESLTIEETFEVGVEAWNLANNKDELGVIYYKKELNAHQYGNVINQMVDYKLKHFSTYNNIIVDFTTENNIIRVKSQTREEHFNNLQRLMINTKPTKK